MCSEHSRDCTGFLHHKCQVRWGHKKSEEAAPENGEWVPEASTVVATITMEHQTLRVWVPLRNIKTTQTAQNSPVSTSITAESKTSGWKCTPIGKWGKEDIVMMTGSPYVQPVWDAPHPPHNWGQEVTSNTLRFLSVLLPTMGKSQQCSSRSTHNFKSVALKLGQGPVVLEIETRF